MRFSELILATLFVTGAASAASAQSDDRFSPIELAAACAPPATSSRAPDHALRIIGSQDPSPRSLFSDQDLLVIGGGTAAGVRLDQQFFVRRTTQFGPNRRSRSVVTLGWLRVVAVNASTAIATVGHICGPMVTGDYLEPFVAPVVPADADRDVTSGQPDFTTLGRVVTGDENRQTLAAGDFALVDWGKAQGLSAGARFAIYRDVGDGDLPLASVGEGVVISVGKAVALARITRARDAVFSGDYIAVRR